MPIPPIVDVAWLRSNLATVVLADVRWGNEDVDARSGYERSHLPGAVFVDLDEDLATPPSVAEGRHPLPDPEAFAVAMRRAGIGDGDTVIAYDEAGGAYAARLVWMLRVTGHDAALLDGGLHAWDGALDRGTSEPSPSTFTPRPWPSQAIVDADTVARVAGGGEGVVVDVRAAERYRGEVEPLDAVAGHIPGAINLPYGDNLDGVEFLAEEGLRDRFADLREADDVVVYCGSGVTACHGILAMERVGITAKLYPGSWSQWSGDAGREIATGATP